MDKNTVFSPEELEVYEHLKEKVTFNKQAVENPTAIVLGGQPGAGKSNLYKIARERFDGNIVELDCDKFREYHPNADELVKDPATYGERTNPFVFNVVDCMTEELGELKYNMIIESSMKSPNTAYQNYALLTPKGYSVEAHVMATPKEISWQGVVDRYNEQLAKGEFARIVPKEFHDLVVVNVAVSLSEIYKSGKMSNIFVFNRDKEVLYDMNKTPNVNPSSIVDGVVNYGQMGGKTVTNNESKDLIEKARQADLADYFRTSGYTLKKAGNEIYIKEIKGLSINPNNNSWYSHYNGIGRINNSIDCLTLILDKSFKDAVYELTGQDISNIRSSYTSQKKSEETKKSTPISSSENQKPEQKKEITMPEHAPTQRRIFGYLHQGRMIPNDVIREFIEAKILYQTEREINGTLQGKPQKFTKANAVFVHRDNAGNEVGGEIQGLDSHKRYKGIVAGTGESYFSFVPMSNKKPVRAFIFESAIDLMSFYSMCTDKSKLEGTMLVSMAGLKPHVPKQLREQGIFVISAVDNDDAGRKFEEQNNLTRSDSVKNKLDIHGFKDWNERLKYQTKHPDFLEKEQQIIDELKESLTEEHTLTRGK